MWLARNKDNTLTLFYYKPLRGEGINAGIWQYDNKDDKEYGDSFMYLPDFMFPNFKWEDEPIEIRLEIINPIHKIICPKCGKEIKYRGSDISYQSFEEPWSGYTEESEWITCLHCKKDIRV